MAEGVLSVAVIGCGRAGARHARAFAELGAEVRWAVDIESARAESIANAVGGAQVATDYLEVLDDRDLDAVSICLPHRLHASVAIAAPAASKRVLCEKPLAGSLEDANRMIETADRARVVLMVAENVWFNPVLLKVRDLLRDGVIGTPAMIRMTRQGNLQAPFKERPWFLDAWAAAGGVVMTGGVHDIETMRMLVGEVESIYALRAPQRLEDMEADDTSVALLRFRNGAVGTLVESFLSKRLATATGREAHTLDIDGELGSIVVDGEETIRVFSERDDLGAPGEATQREMYVPPKDTFLLEIKHFLDCVRHGSAPITSARSQHVPLAVVLAAYRSMTSGEPVTLRAP